MPVSGKSRVPMKENPLQETATMTPHVHPSQATSAMILSDRLLSLAQEADRAGCRVTAEHLLHLAHSVFDEQGFGDACRSRH